MKQKFLKDLGINVEDEDKELLKQFDLNGFLDQISDDRIKEESDLADKLTGKLDEKKEK